MKWELIKDVPVHVLLVKDKLLRYIRVGLLSSLLRLQSTIFIKPNRI